MSNNTLSQQYSDMIVQPVLKEQRDRNSPPPVGPMYDSEHHLLTPKPGSFYEKDLESAVLMAQTIAQNEQRNGYNFTLRFEGKDIAIDPNRSKEQLMQDWRENGKAPLAPDIGLVAGSQKAAQVAGITNPKTTGR